MNKIELKKAWKITGHSLIAQEREYSKVMNKNLD